MPSFPAPLKEIQKFLWSQGDFAGLAEQSLCAADALVRAAAWAEGRVSWTWAPARATSR